MSKEYNAQVSDTFNIQIKQVFGSIGDSTTTIYLLDAGIDNRVVDVYKSINKKNPKQNYRIIGIGQTHYSKALRKRDFIPPASANFFSNDVTYFGQADIFYNFLIDSIMPKYDSVSNNRLLVGHSFSGLFAVYVSTLDTSKFNKCYALSPSLWVNNGNFISNYNADTNLTINRPLSVYYGSRERINKVASSVERFEEAIKTEDIELCSIIKVKGSTHKSILNQLKSIDY